MGDRGGKRIRCTGGCDEIRVHVSRGLHQEEKEHGEEHVHEAYGGFRMNEKEGEEGEHDDLKKDHRDEEHVQDR